MKYALNKTIIHASFGYSVYSNTNMFFEDHINDNTVTIGKIKNDCYLSNCVKMIPYSKKPIEVKHKVHSTEGVVEKTTYNTVSKFYYLYKNSLPSDTFLEDNNDLSHVFNKVEKITNRSDFETLLKDDKNIDDFEFVDYYCESPRTIHYEKNEIVIKNISHSMKQNGVGVLERMNKGYQPSTISLIFQNKKQNLVYIYNTALQLSPTAISCGLTQMEDINYYFRNINYVKSLNEKFANIIQEKLIEILPKVSLGAQLIISTTKKDINSNKKQWLKLTNAFSNTTRYTTNDNSKNNIGTTLLILR